MLGLSYRLQLLYVGCVLSQCGVVPCYVCISFLCCYSICQCCVSSLAIRCQTGSCNHQGWKQSLAPSQGGGCARGGAGPPCSCMNMESSVVSACEVSAACSQQKQCLASEIRLRLAMLQHAVAQHQPGRLTAVQGYARVQGQAAYTFDHNTCA